MSNPEEIIKSESDSSGNIWTETMSDVEPFGQHAGYEQTQPGGTEREKNEESLVASIERGYFEKTPEELRAQAVESRNRLAKLNTSPNGGSGMGPSGEYGQALYNHSIEKYGTDVESCGVGVDDLISLACVASLDFPNLGPLYQGDGEKTEHKKEEIAKTLEDFHRRYFSEDTPEDKRQAMSTIVKKLRFKRDLMDKFGFKRMGRGKNESYYTEDGSRSFRADQLYSQPEERPGLPSEMRDYVFELSDKEATLLAEADDEDVLANTLKRILPESAQSAIIDKMPGDMFKNTMLKNIDYYQKQSEGLLAETLVKSMDGEQYLPLNSREKRKVFLAKNLYQRLPEIRDWIGRAERRDHIEELATSIYNEFGVPMRRTNLSNVIIGDKDSYFNKTLFGLLTEMDFYDLNKWARE